ncbi:MAG TPA: MAC/perforin domain-containing protein [Stenomitos sp.]
MTSLSIQSPVYLLIPGYDYVGKGFDVFGEFNQTSIKQPLFMTTTPSNQTYNLNNQSYVVPQNLGVMEIQQKNGCSTVFSEKSDFSEFLSLQAGIEGNYLAFSGEFNASFGNISKGTSDYQFGLYYLFTDGFAVELQQPTRDNLLPSVLNDPDFQNLPTTYTPENQILFFRFFDKYGTHFIRSVEMGGRLFYSVAIEKSYNFTETEFTANLTAEYNAALFDVKANAQADWKSIDQTWVNNRQVTINAVGGDDSILNVLKQPEPPQNFNDTYTQWLTTLATQPGPVNFTLMGVDAIFSGEQADAVKTAIEAYCQRRVVLNAVGSDQIQSTTGSITLDNQPLLQPNFQDDGLTVAIIDRVSLEPLFQETYKMGWRPGMWNPNSLEYPVNYDYSDLMEDLQEFEGNADVIVAIVFWGQYSVWGYPTQAFYDFLCRCGAGNALLGDWTDNSTSFSDRACAYAIAGVPGFAKGQAVESYAALKPPGTYYYQGMTYPSLTLQVDLKPEYVGGKFMYTPT